MIDTFSDIRAKY